MSNKERGLYGKYHVERIHDPEGKHRNCPFFVLDLTHDPIARVALAAYANQARADGFTALADDLDALLRQSVRA